MISRSQRFVGLELRQAAGRLRLSNPSSKVSNLLRLAGDNKWAGRLSQQIAILLSGAVEPRIDKLPPPVAEVMKALSGGQSFSSVSMKPLAAPSVWTDL